MIFLFKYSFFNPVHKSMNKNYRKILKLFLSSKYYSRESVHIFLSGIRVLVHCSQKVGKPSFSMSSNKSRECLVNVRWCWMAFLCNSSSACTYPLGCRSVANEFCWREYMFRKVYRSGSLFGYTFTCRSIERTFPLAVKGIFNVTTETLSLHISPLPF